MLVSGLGPGDELEQSPAVIGLRETLPIENPPLLQNSIGIQEAVGGHQIHLGMLGPAGEERLQDTGDRGLAHRHRAGDADDERNLPWWGAEKRVRDRGEKLAALHMEVEEPRQRQEGVLDHLDVQMDADTSELLDVVLGQCQGCAGTELRPRRSIEVDVSRGDHSTIRLQRFGRCARSA